MGKPAMVVDLSNGDFLALKEHVSDDVLEAARSKIIEETAGMTIAEKQAFLIGLKLASCSTVMGFPFGQQVIVESLSALIVAASEDIENK